MLIMENANENQTEYRLASFEDLDKLVSINIDDELEYKEINQKCFCEIIL